MAKSSAGKLFFGFLLIFTSSCSFWRTSETVQPTPTPFAATEIKSQIPFSTKEPEVYQAEIISRIYTGSETTERKIFTARNGESRLTVFNPGEKSEVARLDLTADVTLSIHRGRKIYAESAPPPADFPGDGANDFLTAEWLNQKTAARFENLGAENGLLKFRVRLGDYQGAENAASEVLIYVDENLKLPVRQEFYVLTGEQKTLTFSVEMKNFKPEVDRKFFEPPKDFRKVTPKEFQEIIWQERTKNE